MVGAGGSGKTWLASAILAGMVDPDHPRTVCRDGKASRDAIGWVTAPELIIRIRATFSPSARETEYEIVKEMCAFQALLIDDYGAENKTDFSGEALYSIIATRRNHQRFTILTSNLMGKELMQWEPRIYLRLGEYFGITKTGEIKRPIRKGVEW